MICLIIGNILYILEEMIMDIYAEYRVISSKLHTRIGIHDFFPGY